MSVTAATTELARRFVRIIPSCRALLPVAILALPLADRVGARDAAAAEGPAVVEHPTQQELEQGFARWATNHPDAFTFETCGRTLEGRPILMGRITDRREPDDDKQVALLTSAHGAKEMNAVTGLLRLMKWLIGDDAEAAANLFPYGAFGGPRPQRKVEEGALASGPIEHGIVLRLLVPYGDATVTEVRLDGHALAESEVDGYHLVRGPGVIVEIAIPPGRVKDFHIVSCNYDTPTQRRPGFTAADW